MWDPLTVAWEDMFAALTAYKEARGDCNVPMGWKGNPKLGAWCSNTRNAYKNNRLSVDRVKRLEQLGFVWGPYEAAWEQMFAALTAYKQAHGNCNVPHRWKDHPTLGKWCGTQRRNYNDNKLSADRVKRLEQIGFVWDPLTIAWDETWEEMYAALTAYKQTHGDCNVPAIWKDNFQLGHWCSRQRTFHKKTKLSTDQIKRLEQLGFMWDPLTAAWEEMFAALTVYKRARGDCDVPQRWESNPKLASWCANQRTRYKKRKLPADCIKRLERLGFEWVPFASTWEEKFAALTAYKQAHGDCNVPAVCKDNPKLGMWCASQRQYFRKNEISPYRVKRLEDLGFRLVLRKSKRK
jgi:hypothetical protein